MARKTEVVYIDDVDQGPADETVEFAYRGDTWTIDLSAAHAEEFDKDVASWTQYATKVGGGAKAVKAADSGRSAAKRASRAENEHNTRVRDWAGANGIEVATRGRIPTKVAEAYRAANGKKTGRR